MCGRFALHHATAEVAEHFGVEQLSIELAPRYNIAPSQPVAVVRQRGVRSLDACKWGLVPSWAKDPKIGNRMINARAETLAEKPSYKGALKRRRCLIPASGFYEWRQQDGERIPTYIRAVDDSLLALAGLWEEWRPPQGEPLHTCTILTTQANAFMAPIHTRMPVILSPAGWERWLDPGQQELDPLLALLQPLAGDELAAHAVGRQVNAASCDEPFCIQPV
ncbi:MAG: SOS response-associated peptidase [Candidatus Latescibacteria bacterium]|nr:SOS response-associated peptidase [Candidatus Latescibacterota bacterium]